MNGRNVGLFESVDSSDTVGLFAKASKAAKWIKVICIVGIALMIIMTLIALIGGSIIVGNSGGNEVAGFVFGVVLVTLFLAVGIQVLMIWYVSRLQEYLESEIVPSLIFPYIFIVFSVLSIINSIRGDVNIVGIVINLFYVYLWYVVISCVTKARKF